MLKINFQNTRTSVKNLADENTQQIRLDNQDGSQNFEGLIGKLKSSLQIEDLDSSILFKIMFKLFLAALLPLGLKMIEINKVDQLKTILKKEEQKLSDAQAQMQTIKAQVSELSEYKKISLEYVQKKTFLNSLANARLTVPKFLDQIQSIIPNSVWLTHIKVSQAQNNTRDSDELNHAKEISLKGESLNEENLNIFLQSLNQVVQSDTIQFNTNEQKKDSLIRVKFDIKARL